MPVPGFLFHSFSIFNIHAHSSYTQSFGFSIDIYFPKGRWHQISRYLLLVCMVRHDHTQHSILGHIHILWHLFTKASIVCRLQIFLISTMDETSGRWKRELESQRMHALDFLLCVWYGIHLHTNGHWNVRLFSSINMFIVWMTTKCCRVAVTLL